MVGLVPTIHVFASLVIGDVQDVDARHKGEHDEVGPLLKTIGVAQRFIESPAPDLVIAPFIAPPLPTRRRATTEPPR